MAESASRPLEDIHVFVGLDGDAMTAVVKVRQLSTKILSQSAENFYTQEVI
jgi:hypothetical protein